MIKTRQIIVWLFLFFGSAIGLRAQFLEYGGGLGVMNYAGDLDRGYQIKNLNAGVRLFHRMNLSEIVGIKYALGYGKISGGDTNPIDAFAEVRDRSFERNLLEGTLTFEYNFLDFKDEYSIIRWSPYVFGGVGFSRLFGDRASDYSKIQPMLPFGLGFKHLIGKQFSVELEVGFRKMFFDDLDEISDGDLDLKDFQYGNPSDTDWYSFSVISVSYILYKIPCPFRYIPNRSMYRN